MPVAYYICPYKTKPGHFLGRPIRYVAMDDYTPQIYAAGGAWSEVECLGNRAIVKVRAPQELLDIGDGIFTRLPKDRLDDSLADLPATVKNGLKNMVLDMGYTIEEVNTRFPDGIGQYTLRQALRFMASRRLKPRWDDLNQQIVLDGPVQACKDIDRLDIEVVDEE